MHINTLLQNTSYGQLLAVLGYCAIVNIFIMSYWLLVLKNCPEWAHRQSQRFVDIDMKDYLLINYVLFGAYKLSTLFFLIIPYIVIRLITMM